MTVKLSSMRVTADMDVSRYVQALGQKDQADKKAVESTRAVGQALAAVDAASKEASSGLTKLSSAWVEGYREAQKFEREIRSIETLMAKGMGADRAALMLDGLQRKFGQVINAEEAHRRGLTMIAPVVASLKNEYDAMSAAADRAAKAQERAASIRSRVEAAGAFQSSLNERLGVIGGTESRKDARASYSVFSDLIDRQIRQEAEQRAASERARIQSAAALHETIRKNVGILDPGQSRKDAEASYSVFAAKMEADAAAEKAARIRQIEQFRAAQLAERANAAALAAQMSGLRAAQDGQNFNADLNARFGIGAKPRSASESASVFKEMFDAEVRAAEEAARIAALRAEQVGRNFQESLNARFGIGAKPKSATSSAAVFEEQFAEEAAAAARAKQILQSHAPRDVELQRTLQIQKEIDDLTTRGLFTQEKRAELLAVERVRHEQSLKSIEGMHIAMNKYTSGVGFARHEVVNLSRQLQDIVVSLQGGQAPMTVLLQQGTQIADIFATSNASFGGFLRQAATAAGRFAISMAGAATATVAAGAAALYMGQSYADGQREIERAINGVGRASGLSVQRINELAAAEAAAAKVSVSTGRDIVAAFAATGGIRPESASGLIGLTKNYAAQTGQDITAAAAELAKAFSDPVRGADQLNEKLGFLNARTRAYIQSLVDQNDRAGAQRALMDAMSGSVAGAAERVGYLSRAWDAVKNSVSNAADAIGKAVAGEITLEERLASLIQRRAGIEGGLGGGTARGRAQIGRLNAEIENVQRSLYGEGQAQAARAEAVRLAQQSLRVQGIVNEAQPFDEQLRKLKAELADLRNFLGKSGADQFTADMERARKAVEALDHASTTLLSPLERIRKETDAAVQGIMARTLQERTAAELARLQISLSGQKIDAATREAQALDVLKRAQAEANKEARDALRTANDNLSLAGLNPYQRMVRESEIRARENRVRFGGGPAGGMDADFQSKLNQLMQAVPGVSIRSGYRSFEEQAKLYAEKGPGWAAPPGRSMHNHGLAADLQFASPEAKAKAYEMAAQLGLHFPLANRAKNPEPWHIEPIGARDRARAMGGNDSTVDQIKKTEQLAFVQDQVATAFRNANDNLRVQHGLLDIEEKRVSSTAYEVGRAAKAQELMNEFLKAGIPVTDEISAGIGKVAEQYGKLAERAASSKLMMEVQFERDQIFRTSGEQSIAGRLRGTGVGMDSTIADQMRFNQQLEITKSLGTDALKGFISDIRAGKSGMEAMTNALNRLADKLIDMAAESLMSNALGLMFKGNQPAPAGAGGAGALGNLFSGIFGSLFGGGAGGGGGLYQTTSAAAVKFHGGGTVGYGGASMSLPGASIWGVPKFHTGLMHNELLAVLQQGENVLTGRDSARTANTIAGLAAGGGRSQVIINNNAPVEVSTRESRGPMGPRIEVMIDQRIAAAMGPGGAGHRMLRKQGVA